MTMLLAPPAECLICNGRGQAVAGAACPACSGTGVCTREDSERYRQVLLSAALEGAQARFRAAGAQAADGWLREREEARRDALETKARAGQVVQALVQVRAMALQVQQAVEDARAAGGAAGELFGSLPPVPPGHPTLPLPGATADPLLIIDSILVRELDVWGTINAAGAGGLLTNPMTTLGDLITGGVAGAAQRLAVGGANQVLTVVGGVPAWANSAAGFANPMTTAGDLLFENATPAPARLPIGTAGQVLTVAAGLPSWANSPAGFANPMTTLGDLILGGGGGAAGRLGIGAANQVLTVVGGTAAWRTNPAGFANPMTTSGDMIIGTAGGAAARLAGGVNGQSLQMAGGVPTWAANPVGLGWVNAHTQFGADNTGATDASGAIANAVASLGTGGGVVYLPVGTYKLASGIVVQYVAGTNGPIYFQGDGIDATYLTFTGTGDAVRMFNSVFPSNGFTSLQVYGGGISGITIDGTNAGAGSDGLRIGDGELWQVDVRVQNFNAAGSIGVLWDNQIFWTNLARAKIFAVNCSTGIVFNQASGHPDNFYNNYEITLYLVPGQSGILHQNNYHETNSRIKVNGIMNTSTVAGGTLFTLTGGTTHFLQCELDVACDLQKNGVGTPPQTINLANNCFITRCYGRLIFSGAPNWTPSNVPATNQSAVFSFVGPVFGDASLNPGAGPGSSSAGYPIDFRSGTPAVYASNQLAGGTGTIYDHAGDFFQATLSASITVNLGGTGSGSVQGPQRKTIRIKQAAAGGPFTVTWPHNAAPTNTAPTVLWAGGAAPVMTAAASSVDYYFLETLDGATWVGRAVQNVS